MTSTPTLPTAMTPRTANNMHQAHTIVVARGWRPIGPRFANHRWEFVYADQWDIEHAHTLSKLRDLSCTSHILHIGEKLCRLILRDLFPGNSWQYNRRYDWLKEAPDAPALELDIYCPALQLACEHNGRQHLSNPLLAARDRHKALVCGKKTVTLLVVNQPKYITVADYCDLISGALDAAGVSYDACRLKALKSLDGSSPTINAFIKHCYSQFTDEVLSYIGSLGGKLLEVNGQPWRTGGTLSKRSQLRIKLACGHDEITPEAGAMLIAESWCKNCALADHKRQKFQLRVAQLGLRRAYYRSIGVDLNNVLRTPDGRVNIGCERCGHQLQHRSWAFLESMAAGWCSVCERHAQNTQRLSELGWRALGNSGFYQCEARGCNAQFNATHRQVLDFDNRNECCPRGRTGSATHTPVKVTLGGLGLLLRAIHPQGYLIDSALTADDYHNCQCGNPGHLSFRCKQNSLTKRVARKVVDELKHHQLLLPATPNDITPAVNALLSDSGLVWDVQNNYANNALRFLRQWQTPTLDVLLQQGSGTVLVAASEFQHLHRNDYGCTACSPIAVRKKKSLSDYLQAIQIIDLTYSPGRSSLREPSVRLADSGKTIEIECGDATHSKFTRTLSNWNRIASRYCPACKR